MFRAPNFYYQDPTDKIVGSLATAIFGDPQAAQRAAVQRSQQAENDARARLAGAQAEGYEGQNAAADKLPALLAAMAGRQAIPPPMLGDPGSGADPMQAAPPPSPDAVFREGLPALVAALSRMKGDKVDTGETIGSLASFLGGDEMARRGLIAQGQTPGENFAVTPGRADQIAANGYAADQRQAFGVATINHSNDIPVENIKRRSAFDVATVNNRDNIPVAEIKSTAKIGGQSRGERNNNPGNLEYGAFAKSLGATGSDGRFAIFPTFDAGKQAQETLLAGPGYVGGGRNTIDAILMRYAPPSDGNSVDNYGNYVSRVTGIPRNQAIGPEHIPAIAEAMRQFETGGTGKAPKAQPADKPPKAISKAELAMINKEFTDRYPQGSVEPAALNNMRSEAIRTFQRTGDPVGAVQGVIRVLSGRAKAKRAQSGKNFGLPAPAAAASAAPTVSNW